MKAEEYFKNQWPYMFGWIGVDEREMERIVTSAWRAGNKEAWDTIANDREMLEGLLKDLDAEDVRREWESLRRGE